MMLFLPLKHLDLLSGPLLEISYLTFHFLCQHLICCQPRHALY